MGKVTSRGFNTKIQQVDERYAWINDMISSRQGLLIKYMQLLNLKPQGDNHESFAAYDELLPELHQSISEFASDPKAPLSTPQALLSAFCDHLVDYISHGHFDLYPKILELVENASGRSLSIAQRVLPKIEQTTEGLLRFNDRYCEDLDESKLATLREDLARVGDFLEQRFRSEDRLIVGLRLVHSIVATPPLQK